MSEIYNITYCKFSYKHFVNLYKGGEPVIIYNRVLINTNKE